jgi:hypothetical protein
MNEQQLAAVKQALEALEGVVKNCWRDIPSWRLDEIKEHITALQSIISQDAIDWMADNARELGLSYEPAPVKEPVAKRYCCHSCFKASGGVMLDRMILCSECGNKRCPKASDHQLDCTGSNEAGQHGSVYTAPQPVPVKTYHDGKPWPVAPKPWVALTKDDVESWDLPVNPTVFEFVQFIEAKVKEKNHG